MILFVYFSINNTFFFRYLEQIQNDWYDHNSITKKDTFNYELELQALHEMISQTVSALLTDTQSNVKQTLVDSGITKLCVFFGKAKGTLLTVFLNAIIKLDIYFQLMMLFFPT